MVVFKVFLTGDYLTEDGEVVGGELGAELLQSLSLPHICYDFIRDQAPPQNDPTYWSRIYSLEIKPGHIVQANGVITCRPWVKAETFAEGAENLVVIARAGAGYDKIDLEACTENDVVVYNVPDALTHGTASAAFLFMQVLSRRLPELERMVRDYRWDLQARTIGHQLRGHTLGIVGLGHSGMELARLVAPFKMRIIAFSPHASPEQAATVSATLVPELDTLLREADFVSLHCRLTAQTRGMIGERELRLLKPTAYFINVARGELVDQKALVRCLQEHAFAGAGLDVFEVEPLPRDDPLLTLDNVVLTPHWLTSNWEDGRLGNAQTVQGILRAAQGQIPEHVINPQVLDRPGFRAKLARFAVNR
ncbi:MAG: hypothetical protein IT330_08160 [Anaerolineae bacterium]|nr:hypothetical protein [Anaerolineae bacterium]